MWNNTKSVIALLCDFYVSILSSSVNCNLHTQYLKIGTRIKTEQKNKDFVLKWAILPLPR